MSDIATLVASNLDIWAGATQRKSGAGRGGGKRISLYGIERLRALILDLAVRGRLVQQDATDEPASTLLTRLAQDKAEIIPSRKARKSAVNGDDGLAVAKATLPKSWQAVALSQIASVVRGVTYGKSDASDIEQPGRIALLRGHNIQSHIVLQNLVYVPTSKVSKDQFLKTGDIVIAMSSGSSDLVGKAAQFTSEHEVSFGAFCGVIRPVSLVIQPYLAFFCKTPFYRNQTQKGGKGIGIQNLSKGDLEKLVCPFPPLAEQRRIVAKVDELMALCDALERESADAMAAHQALVEELLATLVNSASAVDLAANWARMEIHFDILFTTEASIEALKQTILDLAVRGKLVEQNEEDEAATELLKRIKVEKAKLVAAGKAKRDKPLPIIKESEKFFNLPEGWVWSQPDEFSLKITDGEHFRPATIPSGVYFLSAKDIRETGVSLADPLFVSQETAEKARSRCDPDFGDLLIVSRGATCGRICKVDIDEVFCLLGSVILLKPSRFVDNHYLEIALKSPHIFEALVSASGATAQGAIYLRDLKKIAFPLPPLAEQHRIVAKVDALMVLCKALKARLADAAQTRCHLADAIVEKAAA